MKYIYKITNIINNKCYIGQTKNYKERWKEHKRRLNLNNHENPHLQNAWNKYGEKSFKFEVIEYVENYNEREKYWIAYYKSNLDENGYNIAAGGEEPPHINGCKVSKDQACQIRKALLETQSIDSVCKMFPHITRGHINKINAGKVWRDDKLQYPLCNSRPNCFSEDQVDAIIYDLQQGTLSQKEIANKYNCSRTAITAINQGVNFRRDSIEYPISTFHKCSNTLDCIKQIIHLLKDTNMCIKDIVNMCNVSYSTVYGINSGKNHKKISNLDSYPIRK